MQEAEGATSLAMRAVSRVKEVSAGQTIGGWASGDLRDGCRVAVETRSGHRAGITVAASPVAAFVPGRGRHG
jgi:hypothetical protein